MALGISVTLRNGWLQDLADAIDAGAGPGVIKFYDGVRPATGGLATTLLGTIICSDPCGVVAGGVLTFDSFTDDADADATGTATWARISDSAGTFVADCSVGVTGSGADIELNSTSITAGGIVRINSGTLTAGQA